MIIASHQIFSGQLWHLTDQIKFDQTNLLYIINGEVCKFTIGKQMSGQSTGYCNIVGTVFMIGYFLGYTDSKFTMYFSTNRCTYNGTCVIWTPWDQPKVS